VDVCDGGGNEDEDGCAWKSPARNKIAAERPAVATAFIESFIKSTALSSRHCFSFSRHRFQKGFFF
jgi:hypothetical protein